MKRVPQEHAWGCGVATLAMLLDRPYADILAQIDSEEGHGHNGKWEENGISYISIERMLSAAGFFSQTKYKFWCEVNGEPWPPEPFAPMHYAQVKQPTGNAHFVVMDSDGVVYDPMQEGTFTLSDWPAVDQVHGLIKP